MTTTIRRITTMFCLALIALMGSTAMAGAAGTGTVVSPGLTTTGATATALDGSTTQTFSSTESASMMQPLLAVMYFATPQFTTPPATATRYTITFDYVFTNEDPDIPGTMTVNYAQQGGTGWISFPEQNLWPGTAITAELADKWFVISPAFVAGFNKQGTIKTFAPTPDDDTTTSSSSDVSSVLIVVVIVAAVALLGGGYLIVQRRRSKG